MPVIHMTTSVTSPEVKERLIARFTAAASEETGIPQRFFTVLISELSDTSIGLGGASVATFKQTQKDNENETNTN
ncbi:tautomerase family protein [Desulfobaculum sp.]